MHLPALTFCTSCEQAAATWIDCHIDQVLFQMYMKHKMRQTCYLQDLRLRAQINCANFKLL